MLAIAHLGGIDVDGDALAAGEVPAVLVALERPAEPRVELVPGGRRVADDAQRDLDNQ